MKRLVTAAVAVPVALAAVFYLPGSWFFLTILALMLVATWEYIRLTRLLAPGGPYRSLFVFVPLAAATLVPELWLPGSPGLGLAWLWIGCFTVAVIMSTLVLASRVPLEQGLPAVGLLAFGTAYLALPVASLYGLQQRDPWVVVLLFAIVWLGDTAAFYLGSRFGRRKLAPRVSPNKTWEGSAAGLGAAVLVAIVWSYWRLGSVSPTWLGVAVATSVAAQLGDLVESMIKRGAHVKDSGTLLPGHGGVLDRIDALMFAAPVMSLSLFIVDLEVALT